MTEDAWNRSRIRTIGMILAGNAMDEVNERGERIADDRLLLLLNASQDGVHFKIPETGERWEPIISTQKLNDDEKIVESVNGLTLEGRSVVILRRIP